MYEILSLKNKQKPHEHNKQTLRKMQRNKNYSIFKSLFNLCFRLHVIMLWLIKTNAELF